MSQVNQQGSGNKLALPDVKTLTQAAKLSIKVSKPICFYFYIDSCRNNCSIVTSDGDKIVYKNNDEHTSPIKNTYAVGNEYLVVTENTIYVLSKSTKIVN
tara:strand:- start:460 stop:759 length:300 start_codon:yes stop_codon:yes gene_type:complete